MKLCFDHFAFLARWYDRVISAPADGRLQELLAAEPGQIVLDVGGGTGRHATALSEAGARVIVCDASLTMVLWARAKGLPALVCSAVALPFASAAAERILVVDAFHHFVTPSPQAAQRQAADELLRVLDPVGRLVIEEPDIRHVGVKLIALMEKVLLMGSRFLAADELANLFATAGGRRVTIHHDDMSIRLVVGDEQLP